MAELRRRQKEALDEVLKEYEAASGENFIGLEARGQAGIASFLAKDLLAPVPPAGERERPSWIRSTDDWGEEDWQDYYDSLAAQAAIESFE